MYILIEKESFQMSENQNLTKEMVSSYRELYHQRNDRYWLRLVHVRRSSQ